MITLHTVWESRLFERKQWRWLIRSIYEDAAFLFLCFVNTYAWTAGILLSFSPTFF